MKEKEKTVKEHPAAAKLTIVIFRRLSKSRIVGRKVILILEVLL
jgi:hypothetical protein